MRAVVLRIGLHVFKDSVRDRVLYTLVLFAVLMIGTSLLIAQLTAGQDIKIIKDLGLSASNLIGLLIAVFIGVGLVTKEVERRSIYALLSKPVRRREVVLGKYAGLVLTLAVTLTLMAVAHYLILAYLSATASEALRRSWEAPATDPALVKAYFLTLMELMVVTAIALFFSTFSSPMLSAACTLGLYVVGHLNPDLRAFDDIVGPHPVADVARVLSYVLPNLTTFNITAEVVHAQSVGAVYIALNAGYALTYVALLLVGAVFIFSRRDFT